MRLSGFTGIIENRRMIFMFMELTSKQLDTKMEFIKHYMVSKNAADGSVFDANANVENKNSATMSVELFKDCYIQIKRRMMVDKLTTMFGSEVANEYIKDIKSKEIYIHDETSAPGIPYCVSISMYPFLLNGTKDLNGISNSPKHLDSFCGSLVNLIFAVSSQFAGAVAIPEALLAFNYYAEKDYGDNYLETHLEIIKNRFQEIIYCINQPATARGFQCSFSNFAIFDQYFFHGMFEHFKFPDGSSPNFETFNKLQKFFLQWLKKEREKVLLTFPVVTVMMKTDPITNKPQDVPFADFIASEMADGNSFFLYQSPSVDSLSSCCFDGDQEVITNDGLSTFKTLAKRYGANSKHKIFSNGIFKPGKLIVLDKSLETLMYQVKFSDHSTVVVTDNHIFPTESHGDVMVKDLTVSMRVKHHLLGSVGIDSIQFVEHNKNKVYCFQMDDENYPYFTLPNGIITHNCRLRNEIDSNEFSSTLGCLGVMTGSVHVITMNMNRIIQRCHRLYNQEHLKMPFIDLLRSEVYILTNKLHKYHAAFRAILEDFQKAKMLPVYDAGFITLKKQFSTIGINGMVEGCEFLGIKPGNNEEYIGFVSEILKVIYHENKEGSKKYKFKINMEFVPAENLGYKNAKNDRLDGLFVPRDVYNSYFFPVESESVNVIDKFILHGSALNTYLDGGSALHLNLEEHLTKEQYLKLFELACKTGCNYWCVNVRMTVCNTCEHIDYKTHKHCPKCHSEDIDYATRIIGYLKRIRSFSQPRKIEASNRFYDKG